MLTLVPKVICDSSLNSQKMPNRMSRKILSISCLFLCVVNLMLPVDCGLPPLHVGLAPFALPIIVEILLLMLFIIMTGGNILNYLLLSYSKVIIVFISFLTVTSLLSEELLITLLFTMNLIAIYLINYILITAIIRSGGMEILIKTICFIAACAAIVGILEGLGHYNIPLYEYFKVIYWDKRNIVYALRGSTFDLRVTGTMGNAIIYCTVMMLTLPFVKEIKKRYLRWFLFSIIFLAAFLTYSRTIFIYLAIYGMGYIVLNRKNMFSVKMFLKIIIIAIAMTTIISAFVINRNEYSTFIKTWEERKIEEKMMNEAGGIPARIRIIKTVINKIIEDENTIEVLFGKGFGSSVEAAKDISGPGLATFDNAYISIFYEHGIFVVLAYMALWAIWLFIKKAAAKKAYYWYAIIAYLLTGLSFDHVAYFSVNFLIIVILAIMKNDNNYLGGAVCQ